MEAENAAADDATADDEEPQGPEGKPPTRFGWFIAVWVKKASVYLSLQHTNGKKKQLKQKNKLFFLFITDALHAEYLGCHPLSPANMDYLSGRHR